LKSQESYAWKAKRFCVLAIGLSLVLSGCSVAKRYMATDTAFENRIEYNTRDTRVYNDLKTVAIGSALLIDKRFADGYLELYKTRVQPTDEQFQKVKTRLYGYLDKTTFLINFYSPEAAFSNLDGNSKWQISFSVDGKKLYPIEIKESKPEDWSYLSDINRWDRRYIVRFDTTKVRGVVTVSSILGELRFDFRNFRR